MTPNDLIEFSGFSGISIDFPENQDIEQQGLTTKSDRDFPLYLVRSPDLRLDFIFAETTPTEPSPWLADCWTTTSPRSDLPSRSRILALSRTLVATRQENLISPAFDNVHSVPVQAA